MPPAPDMFSCVEKIWTRALELKGEEWGKEEEGVGKNGELLSLIRGDGSGAPPH